MALAQLALLGEREQVHVAEAVDLARELLLLGLYVRALGQSFVLPAGGVEVRAPLRGNLLLRFRDGLLGPSLRVERASTAPTSDICIVAFLSEAVAHVQCRGLAGEIHRNIYRRISLE